ncbi:MAG TPA: glycosyltransferase family 4 protein [Acidobacteriota bacterium]|jgi:glycosyltransferase involved in cell wall biosynthesis|nr:glycosyltransferase family 4 protein [Acidobacteriota bacterium]
MASDYQSLTILHVHTLPIVSGSGINTLLTMKGSRGRGHRVAIACASAGRLTDAVQKAGMEVFLIPSMAQEVQPAHDTISVFALKRLMQGRHFDLVHTHNSKAGFVGRLAARMARVPTVIHTVHGFAFHDAESALRRALFRSLERRAARWCDGMIFISQPLVDWAIRERIGLEVPKALIYSGIDVEAFRSADGREFRRRLGIHSGQLVVGVVSKLWEGKGHEVLLHAWKEVLDNIPLTPRPVLVIVGEGYREPVLRALTAELKLENSVVFAGFQQDVPAVTAAIDVAVLPSLFEGMGRVVLEAMAAGKPVVASNVGGIPDLVKHGDNGLLVQPGSSHALKIALVEILSKPELRQHLAAGGRAGMRPEFSARHMVEQIHRFYDEIRKLKRHGLSIASY